MTKNGGGRKNGGEKERAGEGGRERRMKIKLYEEKET